LNLFVVLKLVGLLLVLFGGSTVAGLLWSLAEGDGAWGAFVLSGVIGVGVGGALYGIGRLRPQPIYRREALAVVALAWLGSAAVGALPFWFSRESQFASVVDCFFESTSGLTTTGASILTDIEALPRSVIFWRSWLHWVGGVGIIMLVMAVLPYLGVGGRILVRTEVTGPVKETLTPRIADTARLIAALYLGYTAVETVLLMIAGLSFFDALCHTFGTLATGGFSTRNASIAAFDSRAVELIIGVFMILGATNFGLAFACLKRRDPLGLLKDAEWRSYMGLLLGATAVGVWIVSSHGVYASLGQTVRAVGFTVVSISTTTGFTTADYETWPAAAQLSLLLLMFVGGHAGSTGGGVKWVRCLILAGVVRGALLRAYRPQVVHTVKIGGEAVDEDTLRGVLTFLILWVGVFAGGAVALGLLEGGTDLMTPMGAAASAINSIGPGLGRVGPVENYAHLREASKALLALVMLIGRLEIYPILILFAPRFWHSK